jgi:hypothetical protein
LQVVSKSRGDYDSSSLGKVKENVDEIIHRILGTAENARLVAERKFDGGWEGEKRLNPRAY